jgi:hypothetical protein
MDIDPVITHQLHGEDCVFDIQLGFKMDIDPVITHQLHGEDCVFDIQLGFKFEDDNGARETYQRIPEEVKYNIKRMIARLIINNARFILSKKKKQTQYDDT